ncbi:DUF7736 domain-containing protein [Sphingobium sp. TKS]|uniref:DUF7736 domain-containing protein n=1 Tax=Sphingobium sp. TKS TaxID=1315974 RepID=UPI003FA6BEAC
MADPARADQPANSPANKRSALPRATARNRSRFEECALFQLGQDCLCMPFTRFMEGVSALLRRPVFTHEFANPDVLWAEFCQ